MEPSPLVKATVVLIEILFNTYIFLIMLRAIFYGLNIRSRGEPLLQLVLKATNPPLVLLYNFIPGWRNIDFAAILLMLALKMLQLLVTLWLMGRGISFLALFVWASAKLVSFLIYIFLFSILIEVILSWLTPTHSYNPIIKILNRLNEPLLNPIRKKIPPVQGIDFSPMIVIVGLQVMSIILVGYLEKLASIL